MLENGMDWNKKRPFNDKVEQQQQQRHELRIWLSLHERRETKARRYNGAASPKLLNRRYLFGTAPKEISMIDFQGKDNTVNISLSRNIPLPLGLELCLAGVISLRDNTARNIILFTVSERTYNMRICQLHTITHVKWIMVDTVNGFPKQKRVLSSQTWMQKYIVITTLGFYFLFVFRIQVLLECHMI